MKDQEVRLPLCSPFCLEIAEAVIHEEIVRELGLQGLVQGRLRNPCRGQVPGVYPGSCVPYLFSILLPHDR